MYFNGSSAVSFVNLLMKHSRAEEWEGAEISSARGCYTVGQKSKTVMDGAALALPGNLVLSCIGAKYTGEDSIKLSWQEECGGHGACHHHPQNIERDLVLNLLQFTNVVGCRLLPVVHFFTGHTVSCKQNSLL